MALRPRRCARVAAPASLRPRWVSLAADMPRYLAAAVVTPSAVLRPGWVEVAGGRITAVGGSVGPGSVADGDGAGRPASGVTGPGAGDAVVDLGDVLLVPGFVDLHCHGGGGASFGADAAQSLRAVDAHLAHGSTSVMASLVTGPADRMAGEIAALTELVDDGSLVGVHLEGPWLSSAQCGAHDPAQLRPPSPSEVDDLVSPPAVRMVTIAPELDGGLEAVRRIVGHGAVAAVGHTDAPYPVAVQAVEAGARQATHLFNAMRPLRHRDPGPALALLERDDVVLELIRDDVHLDPALCRWLDHSVSENRIVAVTDAMAAAGSSDGRYVLGDMDIGVRDGVARVAGTATIAGSTATMDRLFRTVAGSTPGDLALQRAVLQTSANPARVLRRDDLGAIVDGARADLVVLDPRTLVVRRVMRSGAWVPAA